MVFRRLMKLHAVGRDPERSLYSRRLLGEQSTDQALQGRAVDAAAGDGRKGQGRAIANKAGQGWATTHKCSREVIFAHSDGSSPENLLLPAFLRFSEGIAEAQLLTDCCCRVVHSQR